MKFVSLLSHSCVFLRFALALMRETKRATEEEAGVKPRYSPYSKKF